MDKFAWFIVFMVFCSWGQLILGQVAHAFFVMAIIMIIILMDILRFLEHMNNFGEWR